MLELNHFKLKPTTALVVYERDGYNDHIPALYTEIHNLVKQPDGRYALGEGAPITYESLGALATAFDKQASAMGTVTGLLPENVLFTQQQPGYFRLLWYDKPQPRNFLGTNCEIIAPAPGMLYYLSNQSLSVFATDAIGRPKADTQLYETGWSNISPGSGVVCLGNAQFQRSNATYNDNVHHWTAAFWHSIFTGLTLDSNEFKLLKSLKGKEPYPVKNLTKHTLFANFLQKHKI